MSYWSIVKASRNRRFTLPHGYYRCNCLRKSSLLCPYQINKLLMDKNFPSCKRSLAIEVVTCVSHMFCMTHNSGSQECSACISFLFVLLSLSLLPSARLIINLYEALTYTASEIEELTSSSLPMSLPMIEFFRLAQNSQLSKHHVNNRSHLPRLN